VVNHAGKWNVEGGHKRPLTFQKFTKISASFDPIMSEKKPKIER
jgi:hypothetical protein